MEVVELDPCISEIAKTWFEFKEDERMKIIIEDGLKYIETKGLCSAFFAFKIHVRSFSLCFFISVLLSSGSQENYGKILSRCVRYFCRLMRTNMSIVFPSLYFRK